MACGGRGAVRRGAACEVKWSDYGAASLQGLKGRLTVTPHAVPRSVAVASSLHRTARGTATFHMSARTGCSVAAPAYEHVTGLLLCRQLFNFPLKGMPTATSAEPAGL